MSDSLPPYGLYSLWNSPGQNTGVGTFPFSKGSPQYRDQTQVSLIAGGFFTSWATREAQSCTQSVYTELKYFLLWTIIKNKRLLSAACSPAPVICVLYLLSFSLTLPQPHWLSHCSCITLASGPSRWLFWLDIPTPESPWLPLTSSRSQMSSSSEWPPYSPLASFYFPSEHFFPFTRNSIYLFVYFSPLECQFHKGKDCVSFTHCCTPMFRIVLGTQ